MGLVVLDSNAILHHHVAILRRHVQRVTIMVLARARARLYTDRATRARYSWFLVLAGVVQW